MTTPNEEVRYIFEMDDDASFFESNLHKSKRLIYMGSFDYDDEYGETGVDFTTSSNVVKALLILDSEKKAPITIHYNMIGGDWTHGMAIYDAIRACRSHVTFIGYPHVRSMGTIIIQAADTRILTPSCRFMIHDGFEGMVGKPMDNEISNKESKLTLDLMYAIYYEALKDKHFKSVKKKQALEKISEWCKHDKWFSAKQAIKMGFADSILTRRR